MKRKALAILAVIASTCLHAQQIYKCPSANGQSIFQQVPCVDGKKMDVKAAAPVGGTMLGQTSDAAEAKIRADRMFRTRVAIQERRPIAGMTEDELVQAVGRPSVINASSGLNDAVRKQWVYRGKKDRYVYTENGTVTHIQWTE